MLPPRVDEITDGVVINQEQLHGFVIVCLTLSNYLRVLNGP